jgi:hypothetical protein
MAKRMSRGMMYCYVRVETIDIWRIAEREEFRAERLYQLKYLEEQSNVLYLNVG